jgi:PhnB protein
VNTVSKEEATVFFNGLSKDGQIEMPISESPWNTYFGMLRDKYGIEWMIEFDEKL